MKLFLQPLQSSVRMAEYSNTQMLPARRYAEGPGVRLVVRKREDLPAVRTLVEIKLKN